MLLCLLLNSVRVVLLLYSVDKCTANYDLLVSLDAYILVLLLLILISCLLIDEFFQVLHLLNARHDVLVVLVGSLLIIHVALLLLHGKLMILGNSVLGAYLAQWLRLRIICHYCFRV